MARFRDYRRRLEACAATWFAERDLPVSPRAAYRLADRAAWADNLVLPELAAEVLRLQTASQSVGRPFPLHSALHHGLSSQAMLFNLVLPLTLRDDLDALRPAFEQAGAPWPGPGAVAELEVEDRDVFEERRLQPTSLDLQLTGPHGPPLFVEAKLVETGFGSCSQLVGGECDGRNPARDHDACLLHRKGLTYWPVLESFGFALDRGPLCPMGSYYQFFREIGFALAKGGHLVLLVHGDNPAFYDEDGARGLWPFLTTFVPAEHHARMHRVTLQACARAIEATGRHDDWIGSFSDRYGLRPRVTVGEPTAVTAILATLPATDAATIRELWTDRVLGGAHRDDRTGAAAQGRISSLLTRNGLARNGDDWRTVIDHGRRLYSLPAAD